MNHATVHAQLIESLTWQLPPWGAPGDWVEGNLAPGPTGADAVSESLRAVKAAIKALGDRDRTGARAMLTARRDKLAAKLKLFTGIGRFARGPAAVALIEKIVAASNAAQQAREALSLATRSTVAARRAELDLCEADERELQREVEALKSALTYPKSALIDPNALRQAELDTKALSLEPRRAVALHTALDMGRDATADQAILWIAFENDPACAELYDLRFERWLAAHPQAVAA